MNGLPPHARPFHVTTGRGREFSEYLSQQAPERQRELIAAERRYLKRLDQPTGRPCSTAVDYAEGMRGPTYEFSLSKLFDRVDAP